MEVLAKRLKWLRERERLSQKEVATKIGMTVSGYQKIEYGERDPKLDVLIKLAELYGESTDFLLGVNDKDRVLNELSKEIIAAKAILEKMKREESINLFKEFFKTNVDEMKSQYKHLNNKISNKIPRDIINSFEYRKIYLDNLDEYIKYELLFEYGLHKSYTEKLFDYIKHLLTIPESKPYKDEIVKTITPVHLEIQSDLLDEHILLMFGKDGYLGVYDTFKTEELAEQKKEELLQLLNGR
jgi:transcriptional regulator with XRE-family HTH domain